MRLSDIVPGRTNRALFVGQTGSGKTTLARALLNARRYVVVLDVKGNLDWAGYELVRSLKRLSETDWPKLIYRPPYDELQDADTIDLFFRWVYRRHNTTLYIDETAGVTNGDEYPYHLGACFMRGRELKVETWCATQRPLRIPQIVKSEAEDVYVFKLRLPQDRANMQTVGNVPLVAQERLRKQEFLYAPQDGDVRGPLKLNLTRSALNPVVVTPRAP